MKKKYIRLFSSLMILQFIPYIYSIVRTSFINQIPDASAINILGQIEWFDLIDETLQAFLVTPVFAVIHKMRKEKFPEQSAITMTFFATFLIYAMFSLIVMLYASHLAAGMQAENLAEVTSYLRMETIGFIFGMIVQFSNIIFVILNKPLYIIGITFIKTITTIIGDVMLIPRYAVTGVARTDIMVNISLAGFCLFVLIREGVIGISNPKQQHSLGSVIRYYLKVGIFSGGEIFLNNFIYAVMVCKMINEVQSQGIYWEANNFIWGFMLIPVNALAEIVKKNTETEIQLSETKQYMKTVGIIALIWVITAPAYSIFLNAMHSDPQVVQIVYMMIPFYIAYALSAVIDGQFIGSGKTYYNFYISLFVNIVYYGIWFILFRMNLIQASLSMICMEFGFGNVVHLLAAGLLLRRETKQKNSFLTLTVTQNRI